MKPCRSLNRKLSYPLFPSLAALFFLPVSFPAAAQTPVTAEFAHWVNATTSTTYSGTGATGNAGSGLTGDTYNYAFGTVVTTPNRYLLDSFTAVGLNFHFAAPTTVKFRRVDNASVTGLRKSLWFEQNSATTVGNGGTISLRPDYDDSLERIFSLGQIFNIGIDNDFENSTNTNNNNIERVDQIVSTGVSATDGTKAGFVVFDRGNGGGHDPFYIAAIKTLDANGDPSAYYNAVSVAPGNYGSNVPVNGVTGSGAINYITMRENPADAHLLMMNNSSNQYRDGVFLRFSDLGVANGTKIYGYSLFGTDVNISSAANLVDYTNTTNFPTGSDFNNGGLDQVAVTGLWVTNASYVVLADPVIGLSARVVPDGVRLSWDLGVTAGPDRLVVERASNGMDFTSLIEFDAPLASSQTILDGRPLRGQNDYRLKLVDQSGAVVAYSTVSSVALDQNPGGVCLTVYPNPVSGQQLNFAIQGLSSGSYYLRLRDMSGRILVERVFSAAAVFSGTLDLPRGIASGVYSLQVAAGDGSRVSTAVVQVRGGR